MTPEQQRIAIAQACGWINIGWHPRNYFNEATDRALGNTRDWWRHPDKREVCMEADLPDYLNDLNACHEMEKAMDREQAAAYHDFLRESTPSCATMKCWADRWTYHANAAQRCEAFLRTKGILKD